MSDTELRIERLIAAPPRQVFALWTQPDLIVKWWGPEGFDVPTHSFDITQGGRWRTTMRSPEGSLHTVSGEYREIVPDSRLVFTWGWDDDSGKRGHETEVAITFEATPGGTKLVLLQREFENKESRDKHQGGWSSSFNCLAQTASQHVEKQHV